MRKIKKIVFLTVCVCGLMTLIWAQDQKFTPVQAQAQMKPIRLVCDLKVDVIHASRCKCDLNDVDAFYMGNIMVDVANASGVAAESVLTVTYFDLAKGGLEVVTKNLARLNPYPTNPWCFQMYVVVDHPVLVKKSVGIKAEIKPVGSIVDSQPANNVKKVYSCSQMVY